MKKGAIKTTVVLFFGLNLILSARGAVLPADFRLFGKTVADYAGEAYQYKFSLSTNGHYLFPRAGPWESDPVYFLQGVDPSLPQEPGIQTYVIPDNVYIFFPIIAAEWDNIDTWPPLTIEQLRDIVIQQMDSIIELHFKLDGVPLARPFAHRAAPAVFSTYEATSDNVLTFQYGHPITGLIDPMVADGYWLMIAPLSPGLHLFNTGASQAGVNGYTFDRYFQVRILRAGEFLAYKTKELAGAVTHSSLSPRVHRQLLEKLRQAADAFDDGHFHRGMAELREFQAKVQSRIAATDTALAATFAQSAQKIMDQAVDHFAFLLPLLDALGTAVAAANLPPKRQQELLNELSEAGQAFARDNVQDGIEELREFQHRIRKEALDETAGRFLQAAQEIIDQAKAKSGRDD